MVWNSREDEIALYGSGSLESSKTSTRRKCTVTFVVLLLAGILLAIIVPVTLHARNSSDDSVPAQQAGPPAGVTTACSATQYPDTCSNTLQNSTHSDARIFTSTTVAAASTGVDETRLSIKNSQTPENAPAVEVCLDTLTSASAELEVVLKDLNTTDKAVLNATFDDIKTRLTAAMEFHTTCLDALEEVGGPISPSVQAVSKKSTHSLHSETISSHGLNPLDTVETFPLWVGMEQRRHLLQTVPANGTYNVGRSWTQ
nr:pectinesterase 3-like [Physcomitrium patens]|eukprot:XP_024370380.1 pectinesterase 3-like [Physcomitrella patens]